MPIAQLDRVMNGHGPAPILPVDPVHSPLLKPAGFSQVDTIAKAPQTTPSFYASHAVMVKNIVRSLADLHSIRELHPGINGRETEKVHNQRIQRAHEADQEHIALNGKTKDQAMMESANKVVNYVAAGLLAIQVGAAVATFLAGAPFALPAVLTIASTAAGIFKLGTQVGTKLAGARVDQATDRLTLKKDKRDRTLQQTEVIQKDSMSVFQALRHYSEMLRTMLKSLSEARFFN